jgi:hypothetical protein
MRHHTDTPQAGRTGFEVRSRGAASQGLLIRLPCVARAAKSGERSERAPVARHWAASYQTNPSPTPHPPPQHILNSGESDKKEDKCTPDSAPQEQVRKEQSRGGQRRKTQLARGLWPRGPWAALQQQQLAAASAQSGEAVALQACRAVSNIFVSCPDAYTRPALVNSELRCYGGLCGQRTCRANVA